MGLDGAKPTSGSQNQDSFQSSNKTEKRAKARTAKGQTVEPSQPSNHHSPYLRQRTDSGFDSSTASLSDYDTTALEDESPPNSPATVDDDLFCTPKPFVPLPEPEVPVEEMTLGKKMGDGAYATVRMANWEQMGQNAGSGVSSASYAFKSAKDSNSTAQAKQFAVAIAPKLEKEAELLSKAGYHQNICTSYGLQTIEGKLGILYELIPGADFEHIFSDLKYCHQAGLITLEENWGTVQFVLHGTLTALDHIQSHGLVHADIKPSNLRYDTNDEEIKVLDFGQAGYVGEPIKPGHEFYAAPEVIKGVMNAEVTANNTIDSYSVGQIAYQCGFNHPFTAGKPFDTKAAPGQREGLTFATYLRLQAYSTPSEDGHYRQAIPDQLPPEEFPTHYTGFVNSMLHPSEMHRLSPADALLHPFITFPLCAPQKARDILKKTITDPGYQEPVLPEEE
ncbi:MAG: serine/threonine-protein kinase [Desulfovibrionales bacterium]|nr:serine/threonine-protein kinase [Desulfovibrionales bacterium]